MAGHQLASAGDDVCIWDIGAKYSLVKQYNPHTDNVACIHWSYDNQYLASVSTAGDKICTTLAKNNSFTTSLDFGIGEGKTSVCFNSNSRCILAGGKDGQVTLYDIKSRKVHKSYKSHKAAVTSVQFNYNDTYVASASQSGEIILFNTVTGIDSPITSSRTQGVLQLQFNHFKKYMLASVSDDGSLDLWDTNGRRNIHTFSEVHKAPATGLVFSRLNDMLLLSVGLDKRVICYDISSKSSVKCIPTDAPLTSIDASHDGCSFAVGTTRGKIYIYDLRGKSQPVHIITNAHKSSVQSLHFQNTVKASTTSSSGSTSRGPPRSPRPSSAPVFDKEKTPAIHRAQTPVIQRAQTPAINSLSDRTNLEVEKSHLSRLSENSFDAISPLRDVNEAAHSKKENMGRLQVTESQAERLRITPSRHSDRLSDGAGLFSPISEKCLDRSGSKQLIDSGGLYSPINPNPVSDFTNVEAKSSLVTQNLDKKNGPLITKPSDRNNGKAQISADHSNVPNGSGLSSDHLYSPPTRETAEQNQNQPEKSSRTVLTPKKSTNPNTDDSAVRNPSSPRPRSRSRLGVKRADSDADKLLSGGPHNIPPEGATPKLPASDWDFLSDPAGGLISATKLPAEPTCQYKEATPAESSGKSINNSSKSLDIESVRDDNKLHSLETVPDIKVPDRQMLPQRLSETDGASADPARFLSPVQVEFMRNIIKDSMEEFRDQIHDEIRDMHYEMIRQFSIQMEEMRHTMQSYSVNHELLAEIQRLKEENSRLKKKF